MKIKVTMKDPDTMYDCVQDAVKDEVAKLGLPDDEAKSLVEMKAGKDPQPQPGFPWAQVKLTDKAQEGSHD